MPRIVRTARGEQVDFDTIVIKQQLANAPMNIEVAKRKEFIDTKEKTGRKPAPLVDNFDDGVSSIEALGPVEEPIPNLPERKKKS